MPKRARPPDDEAGETAQTETRMVTFVQGYDSWARGREHGLNIEHRVSNASVAGVHACWLLTLYAHRECEAGNFTFPMNGAVAKAACGLVSRTTGKCGEKQPQLKAAYESFAKMGLPKPDGGGCTQIFSALGIEIATSWKNYLEEALEDHGVYYIRRTQGLKKPVAERIWHHLAVILIPAGKAKPSHPLQWKADHTPLSSNEEAILTAVRVQFAGVMCRVSMLYRLITLSAACPDDDRVRIPLLFPQRTIRLAFISFDKQTLNIEAEKLETLARSMLPKGVKFPVGAAVRSFKTDLSRITVTLELPGEPRVRLKDTRPRKTATDDRPTRGLRYLTDLTPGAWGADLQFEGFDPGLTSLFIGSKGNRMDKQDYRAILCSGKVHRRQAQRAWPGLETLKTFKVASSAGVLEAIAARVPSHDSYWEHYTHKWYGRARFQQSRLKHRAMDIMANRLQNVGVTETYAPQTTPIVRKTIRVRRPAEGGRRVPMIGHAIANGSMKGVGPLPTVAIKEHVAKKCLVGIVDEFRTSVSCSTCKEFEKMDKPKSNQWARCCQHCERFYAWDARVCCDRPRPRHEREIYSAFRCKTCGVQWHRDENASKNIEFIVAEYITGRGRPFYLARQGVKHVKDTTTKKVRLCPTQPELGS